MTKRLGNIPIKRPMLWMSKSRLVTSLFWKLSLFRPFSENVRLNQSSWRTERKRTKRFTCTTVHDFCENVVCSFQSGLQLLATIAQKQHNIVLSFLSFVTWPRVCSRRFYTFLLSFRRSRNIFTFTIHTKPHVTRELHRKGWFGEKEACLFWAFISFPLQFILAWPLVTNEYLVNTCAEKWQLVRFTWKKNDLDAKAIGIAIPGFP